MSLEPHWTAYVSALLVPTVAILGSIIAYFQWKTAQDKLKLDLFERRLNVYAATMTLLGTVTATGKVKDGEGFDFLVGVREAKWLFGLEIATYLEIELYHNVVRLQTLEAEREGMSAGVELSEKVRKQGEIKKWIFDQYPAIDKKFAPFMKLGHVK